MKRITISGAPGSVKYAVLRKLFEAVYWDATAKVLTATPSAPYLEAVEDAVMKGVFTIDIDGGLANGQYVLAVYTQSGASPSPVADGEPDVVYVRCFEGFITELSKGGF